MRELIAMELEESYGHIVHFEDEPFTSPKQFGTPRI